jgi:hypothetical protein
MEDQPTGVMDLPPIAYYMMGDVADPGASDAVVAASERDALQIFDPGGGRMGETRILRVR